MRHVLLVFASTVAALSGCSSTTAVPGQCRDSGDCQGGEVCSAGLCSTACNLTSECDPGFVCETGRCVKAGQRCTESYECDDENPCTLDACSMALGVCVSAPAPSGTPCDDDSNPCTADMCDSAGACVKSNIEGSCDDLNACTQNDSCVGGTCVGGEALNCNDSNDCTEDACEPGFGCVHAQRTGLCDDGNSCTTDMCDNGVCVGTVPGCAPPRGCEIAPSTCLDPTCTYEIAGAGTPCRSSNGPCDVAEVCDGNSPDCPVDGFVAPGAPCRTAAGTCDVVEYCTGSVAACPANALAASGTECNPSLGLCDPAEICTGTSVDCPNNVLEMSGVRCRASLGECDAEEVCTGASPTCPGDANVPDGSVCSMGLCAGGTCTQPQSILNNPENPEISARFGDALAMQNSELIVGEPLRGLTGNPDQDRGVVHLYQRNAIGQWVFDETILPPVSTTQDRFGEDIAISGDTLVIGADRNPFSSGAYVAIYERAGDSWTLLQTLPNGGDAVSAKFGNRVDVDGETVIIMDSQKTHVYVRSGMSWILEQSLDILSVRIGVSGNTISMKVSGSAAIEMWERNTGTCPQTWCFDTQLTPSPAESDDAGTWGIFTHLVGDTFVVGAPRRDEGGPVDAGRAYVYNRVGGVWQTPQVLSAPTPVAGMGFGSTVTIDGDHLAVGANGDSEIVTRGGAIYLFERIAGVWQFHSKVTPNPILANDEQGGADVVLQGQWVAYSGERADVSGEPDAGRVFVEFVNW